jgi:hypothetical protein
LGRILSQADETVKGCAEGAVRTDDGSVDIRKLVRAFADEAVYQVHEFNEFRTLYYSSERRIDLLNVTAKTFFSPVQQYVTLVYEHLFHDVFALRTVAFYGAEDLIGALKDAHALRRVLKRDPLAYDRLLRDSGFADA